MDIRKRLLLLSGKKMAATVPWYLAGGVDAANCVAAYQAIGAASYAASKINLINPGTYDATDGTTPPTWGTETGWVYDGANIARALLSGVQFEKTFTVIAQFANGASNFSQDRVLIAAASDKLQILRGSGTKHYYMNGGGYLAVDTALIDKHNMAIANTAAYLDGSPDGIISTGDYTAGGVTIGNNSAQTRSCVANIYAVAIYNTTLTAPQIAAISALMALLP